jgi:hypothetical protein
VAKAQKSSVEPLIIIIIMIIQLILKELRVKSSCEYGNEPSSSIIGEYFLDLLEEYNFSRS